MDIILIPGLWLDGSSWDGVVPLLAAAGHRPHPMTLPGMESAAADRSAISLRDHVEAVVGAIDAIGGKVVLVGHSAGAAIAHAAVDARPDRVSLVVHVGGFPTGHGEAIADGFPAADGEVPLPPWDAFDDGDLRDLDEAALDEFRRRAIPSPERVTRDPQQLSDDRRYDVPVTVVATEFTAEMLCGWIDQGLAPVSEFARIRSVEIADLPTGHWPQFTRPAELAQIILASIEQATARPALAPGETIVDAQGRPEPPLAADETTTLLGFLDFQRATLAWKCAGLDAAGLGATVGVSSVTLGGLLKHLALVEESWFRRALFGRDHRAPWDEVDWKADPDWDWHSAADDSPEQLRALWQDAVDSSRALVAEALAQGGLDQPARHTWHEGPPPSLRWILVHMIEEYARHNGHADLLREAIDGQTGE